MLECGHEGMRARVLVPPTCVAGCAVLHAVFCVLRGLAAAAVEGAPRRGCSAGATQGAMFCLGVAVRVCA